MNLLRFPLVVLTEIFKNLDFREKFLITLLSERAKNTLKLTSAPTHLIISLTDEFFIHAGPETLEVMPSNPTVETLDYRFKGEMIRFCLHRGHSRVILPGQSPRKQLMLAHHVLDTFRKPTISVECYFPALPTTVRDFMKMANQQKVSIESFEYNLGGASFEFISRILDECTEVTDSIKIYSIFPDNFVYNSPRPFKAKNLYVSETINWMNLKNFVNCRHIDLPVTRKPNRTPQSWNTFFRFWLDSDSPLEYLRCCKVEASDFPLMVDGLSNEGIQRDSGDAEWIDLKRRDGSEFVIGRVFDRVFIMTKREHSTSWWIR
uniref:F-box domain-containing protein n=1 Tax=Caenorhabditis tropicalis TaxID=1561998 RepID=A0A1I7UTM5_9PELO